jgi:hypothetical protein
MRKRKAATTSFDRRAATLNTTVKRAISLVIALALRALGPQISFSCKLFPQNRPSEVRRESL